MKMKNNMMLLPMAFAAVVLGACSSDDVANEGGNTQIIAPGQKGYVSVSINLPTQPSTRADSHFNDGVPEEYNVNDGKLILFKSTDQTDLSKASLVGIYDLGTNIFGLVDDSPNQITSKATVLATIDNMPSLSQNEKLYALVVLNSNGLFQGDNTNGWIFSPNTNVTKAEPDLSLNSYGNFYNKAFALNVTDFTDKGFFMTNAPLFTKAGGNADPTSETSGTLQTLVEIDPQDIKSSESDASASPAGTFYVERAVAKVTVNGKDEPENNEKPVVIANDGNPLITGYKFDGWMLNTTNKKSFIVRNAECDGEGGPTSWWSYANANVTTDEKYRFVGKTQVEQDVYLYRTYWGVDPNYSTQPETVSDEFNVFPGEPAESSLNTDFSGISPCYCLENTFDINSMKTLYTTAVWVKAKLTVNGAETSEDGSFYYTIDNNTSTVYNKESIKKYVQKEVLDYLEANTDDFKSGATITGDNVMVTLSNEGAGNDKGGKVTVTATFKDSSGESILASGITADVVTAKIKDNVMDSFNKNTVVNYYKQGYAYYPIFIKHFGDSQTPLSSNADNTTTTDPDEENKTPYNDNDHLGRYGVLRNNWYDIQINGLKTIGYPDVPEVITPGGDNPNPGWDDDTDKYLSVTINVLSWAKRSQDVSL